MEIKPRLLVAVLVLTYIIFGYLFPENVVIEPLNMVLGTILNTEFIKDGFSPGRLVYWSIFWPSPIFLIIYGLVIILSFRANKKR